MLIYTVIVFLLAVFISSVITKNYKNPLFYFSFIWGIVLFLYKLNLFGILGIKDNTENILVLGIIGFLGGFGVTKLFHKQKNIEKNRIINYQRLRIITVFIVVSSLPFYIKQVQLVLSGVSIAMNKVLLSSGEVDSGGVWMQYIVRPYEIILIPISSFCLLYKKEERVLVWSGIGVSLLKFISTGSKTSLAYYIICLFIAFVIKNYSKYVTVLSVENNLSFSKKKEKKQTNNSKRKYLLGSIIFGVVIFLANYMDIFIQGFKNLYFYLCGCIPMLDKVINDPYYIDKGFTYGNLSFNSVIRLITKPISIFNIDITPNKFELANTYYERFEKTTEVAPGVNYNAFVTMFANYYVDFGTIGVLVLSILFGILIGIVYKRMRTDCSLVSFIQYCILIYYTLFSIVRFNLSNTIWGFALIYSIFLLRPIFCFSSHKNQGLMDVL